MVNCMQCPKRFSLALKEVKNLDGPIHRIQDLYGHLQVSKTKADLKRGVIYPVFQKEEEARKKSHLAHEGAQLQLSYCQNISLCWMGLLFP